jgi:MinD superfamily P-loop ATPase
MTIRNSRVIAEFRRTYEDRCTICGWCSAACDVHHIKPLKDGGADTLPNLIYLCPSCHRQAGLGHINQARLIHARRNMIRRREAPNALFC